MKNESKTFESSKLDSNCDSSLILSRSSNFDCNCSLSRIRIAYSWSNRELLVPHP